MIGEVRAVWFNAWLCSHQPALWRALISRILDGVRGFETLDQAARADLRQLEARLYKSGGGRKDLGGVDTRILRAGSWANDSLAAVGRCGYRGRVGPGGEHNFGGFRCATRLSRELGF
jgi:hypothetical protein